MKDETGRPDVASPVTVPARRGDRHVVAVKASPVRLDRDMTVEQGFKVIVANCLSHVRANQAGVAGGIDPESIHQMRVGIRRLRSALQLFGGWIPLPLPLHDELGWLGNELGAARDADVLAGETLVKVAQACPQEEGLAPLRRSAITIAGANRKRAAAAVRSVRYAQLMLGLAGWLQESRWRPSVDEPARRVLDAPIGKRARRILVCRHRRLIERGTWLEGGTRAQRHRVRIAAKKARYATEFFQSLHAGGRVRRYIRSLAALQDALGGLNDAAVADRLLLAIGQRQPALAASAGFARGYLAATEVQDVQVLVTLWRRFVAIEPP